VDPTLPDDEVTPPPDDVDPAPDEPVTIEVWHGYTETEEPIFGEGVENFMGGTPEITIEREAAAMIDGATQTQSSLRVIRPLSMPGMAVTALWGFLTGWSEFTWAWTFLVRPTAFTLPMVLRGMEGGPSSSPSPSFSRPNGRRRGARSPVWQ
jgi:hypothetical protein